MTAHTTPPTGSLVGRDAELDILASLLDGDGGRLTITGEPGIGKTRLATELAGMASERGAVVLRGRGVEFERELPFGVFADALDVHLATLGQRWIERFPPGVLAELAHVLPALSDHRGSGRIALRSERWRLHRAVGGLLEELAQQAPLVLILDDAHWADEASIELIAHLLDHLTDARLLLALAYRPRQAPPSLTDAIDTARGVTRINLRALELPDATQLLGASLSADVRSDLHRDTGGNPFYLLELARAYRVNREEAVGITPGSDDPGIPPSVLAAIAGELQGLSDAGRCLAQAAAVVGVPFDSRLAATVASLPAPRATAARDELVRSGLIVPTDKPTDFAFRHPIVRRAVYDSCAHGWRIGAHARAERALAERGAPAHLRAHHLERSAASGDEHAIETLAVAGDEAASRAPATAAHWYEAALRLLTDAAPGDRRLRLLLPLSASLVAVGRIPDSRSVLDEALAALPLQAHEARAHILGLIAAVEHLRGRHAEARALLTRALAGTPAGSSGERATLELELALGCWFAQDWDELVAHARRAARLADQIVKAEALSFVAIGELYRARSAAALERIEEAATLVAGRSDEDLIPHVRALLFLGEATRGVERFPQALEWFERGVRIARNTGQDLWFVALTSAATFTSGWLGRLDAGARHADTARRTARTLGDDQELILAGVTGARLALLQGDLPTAIARGQEATAAARLAPSALFASSAHLQLAEVSITAGDVQRGMAMLLEYGGGAELPAALPDYRSYWYEVLAEAELALRRQEAAEGWVRRAEDSARSLGLSGRIGMAQRARARVLLARGDAGQAAVLAAAAGDRLYAIDQRVDAGRADTLHGQALATAGRARDAVARLERAYETLADCGATRYADEAAQALRQLGHTPPPRSRRATGVSVAALSPRQLEVARLVGLGLTNSQIADELFVSEKTVEKHLARVFEKLGASSRAAVAVAMARGDGGT